MGMLEDLISPAKPYMRCTCCGRNLGELPPGVLFDLDIHICEYCRNKPSGGDPLADALNGIADLFGR